MQKNVFGTAAVMTMLLLTSLVPHVALAAPADGSLVKSATSNSVYYVAGGKRLVFPSVQIYHSWFSDFSTVSTISDKELAALPIAGNMPYKGGVRLVKVATDPKVYAVQWAGTLRWVRTEEVATALYGADWNKKVDDLSDAFFAGYKIGTDIMTATDFNPTNEAAMSWLLGMPKSPEYEAYEKAGQRDSKRVRDILQLQVALELYQADARSYPKGSNVVLGVSEAKVLTDKGWNPTGEVTYMGLVPAAPTPADGTCTADNNQYLYNSDGTSYTITFCIGRDGANHAKTGLRTATPEGIE